MKPIIDNPESFRAEAGYQRLCAACGVGGPYHAHHVISQHLLKKLHLPLFDTRGALRLCPGCHMSMEWGGVNRLQVDTSRLTNDNICYIWETFHQVGTGILDNRYTGADSRWQQHLEGECECQAGLK